MTKRYACLSIIGKKCCTERERQTVSTDDAKTEKLRKVKN